MRERWTAWPRALAAALLAAACCAAAFPAAAAGRVALVVGNGAYAHEPKLANPVNDAADMAKKLRGLGFEVELGLDLDREGFFDRLEKFADASRGAEAALFFYAGHGLQVDGTNYIAPVDVALTSTLALKSGAVELGTVMEEMRGETNLVFLDACRDNPLAASGTRGAGRGLARVEDVRRGTLIAFATRPGGVADDGDGRNSPFTAALLEHIGRPGESVTDMLTSVTASVVERTAERQEPWMNLSMTRKFYFAPGEAPSGGGGAVAVPGGESPAPGGAADRVFWESAERSGTAADYEAYLETFPTGLYARLARNRLARLGGGGAVSPPGPVPAPGSSGADHVAVEAGLDLKRADRLDVQSGLKSLGFDVGSVDGAVGGRTRRAISSWQSAKGFEATGHLTEEQAEALIAVGRETREREAAEREERATRARDDAAFARARRSDTVAAYEGYLSAYRFGAHVSEARRLLAARKRAERERIPEVGEVFEDCWHCPRMVVVRSGSFTMGSPASEQGRYGDEGPQHRVTIGSLFAVGVYEVTFDEWDACVSGGGCGGYRPDDRGWGRGRRPVINVSWEDAQSYVSWLSRETGESYRLLSEPEWEYVARAGTETRYWWGNDSGRNRANCDGCGSRWDDDRTAPAGSFSANPFGLHDVHGNVWEWVEDCWNDSYAGAPHDGSAWESGNCSRRVLRGGSWNYFPRDLRAAYRDRDDSGNRSGNAGFRVARTFTP